MIRLLVLTRCTGSLRNGEPCSYAAVVGTEKEPRCGYHAPWRKPARSAAVAEGDRRQLPLYGVAMAPG